MVATTACSATQATIRVVYSWQRVEIAVGFVSHPESHLMFARPLLVSSRKVKPSSFHAGRRQMHIVDSVTENRCCSQATSIRCSTHVKQMRRHSKTWQWRAREHAQKAVEDGVQVDTTHHGGISLHKRITFTIP